jgi:hypothetical protein
MIQISTTSLEIGDGLIAKSKCSNSTFIMLYLYHEIDVDYLVVNGMTNTSKLFDYNFMFSICANLSC